MKTVQIWVILLVGLFAYDVYSAAIPDDEDGAAVQARPAPVGAAGAHRQGRNGKKRQGAANATMEANNKPKQQRKAQQKNGAVKQGAKNKQQPKGKRGKIRGSKSQNVPNENREELSPSRNKNQFKKQPANKLDRQTGRADQAPESTDDETIDYGPPQKIPGPGNRLVPFPKKPTQGGVVSSAQGDAMVAGPDVVNHQDHYSGKIVNPSLPNGSDKEPPVAQIAVLPPDYKEPHRLIHGRPDDGMMRPAVMPQDYKEPVMNERPVDDTMMKPIVVMEGPEFYQGGSVVGSPGLAVASMPAKIDAQGGEMPQVMSSDGKMGIMALPERVEAF